MGEAFLVQKNSAPLGLSASTPASSANELRDLGYSSGTYWINWGGTTKEIYCDMDNNGGGWMLYASFATDNDYSQAAITKSRMLEPEFNTYGFDLNYRTHWSDGINGSLAYTRRPGWFAHFYSSSPNGQFTMTSYQGPTNVSEMRIRHGGGATSYSGPSGYVMTNGVNRGSGPSNPTGTTITVASFNPSGSTPLFRQVEQGIAGLSDIWVR